MVKPASVAVLDVGKTNKKVRIYNRELQVLSEERTTLATQFIEGLEVEPTTEIVTWFYDALKGLAKKFDIQAIAITTHGATYALLDEQGNLAHPVISYTAEKGAEVQAEFYETFGDRVTLHRSTCTPDVGFANIAKSLYYIKTRKPDAWAKAKHAVFFTGFLGQELTGQMGIEPTYVGNHTYLWNFHTNTWSTVARALGADMLFPREIGRSWEPLGLLKPEVAAACGLSEDCLVTYGIHDSNANFLSYLAQGQENFMLNSTGSWCVSMKQAPTADLTDEEIRAKVFYNLDALGRPIKTAIFPGGMDYEKFGHFTELEDSGDREAAQRVVRERKLFVIPGVLPDASVFQGVPAKVATPERTYTFDDLETQRAPMTALGQDYFAALNLGLAIATREAMNRCGADQGTTVYLEGGFTNNRVYCELLAALCPGNTIALTSQKEGTSFGAALTGWMMVERLDLEAIGKEFTIESTAIPRRDYGDLDAYVDAFKEHLRV